MKWWGGSSLSFSKPPHIESTEHSEFSGRGQRTQLNKLNNFAKQWLIWNYSRISNTLSFAFRQISRLSESGVWHMMYVCEGARIEQTFRTGYLIATIGWAVLNGALLNWRTIISVFVFTRHFLFKIQLYGAHERDCSVRGWFLHHWIVNTLPSTILCSNAIEMETKTKASRISTCEAEISKRRSNAIQHKYSPSFFFVLCTISTKCSFLCRTRRMFAF